MYYIYAYIDPRDNLPFYIGKGKGYRKNHHIHEDSSKKENKEKYKIIQELLDLGMFPIITELESGIITEPLAYNREDYFILLYGRRGVETGGILTNKTIGGKHPPTPVWTEERKKQHSNWNKSYWTDDRKKLHTVAHSIRTVSVTDRDGNSKRIPKTVYDQMDRTTNINNWEYVSVSSNEGKKRKLKKSP